MTLIAVSLGGISTQHSTQHFGGYGDDTAGLVDGCLLTWFPFYILLGVMERNPLLEYGEQTRRLLLAF
jgi:hypothetical protein